jgi:hypothetical protein
LLLPPRLFPDVFAAEYFLFVAAPLSHEDTIWLVKPDFTNVKQTFLCLIRIYTSPMAFSRQTAPSDSERWVAADAALQARKDGPHGLARHAEASKWPAPTLRRWARVAASYPPDHRGLIGVSFSHFECVAAHPHRLKLLKEAARYGWAVGMLRTVASETPTTDAAQLKTYGPQTLDTAIEYCRRLLAFEPDGQTRMASALLPRLQTLAGVADTLACNWREPGQT